MRLIELHQLAPAKPRCGQPCNGCGVCCALEPCPVALVFLLQRKGRCRALLWDERESRYVCGMVRQPDSYSRLIPKSFGKSMGMFFASRIAAGKGCDAEIELENPS